MQSLTRIESGGISPEVVGQQRFLIFERPIHKQERPLFYAEMLLNNHFSRFLMLQEKPI